LPSKKHMATLYMLSWQPFMDAHTHSSVASCTFTGVPATSEEDWGPRGTLWALDNPVPAANVGRGGRGWAGRGGAGGGGGGWKALSPQHTPQLKPRTYAVVGVVGQLAQLREL
jgi:hypothetical protein